MSTHHIPFSIKKENHPKLSQICSYGSFSKVLKNEFETAVVNEPSVFEPLKFYYNLNIVVITCNQYVITLYYRQMLFKRLNEFDKDCLLFFMRLHKQTNFHNAFLDSSGFIHGTFI